MGVKQIVEDQGALKPRAITSLPKKEKFGWEGKAISISIFNSRIHLIKNIKAD